MMKFQNTYVNLPDSFFEKIAHKNSFKPQILAFNENLNKELGLDLSMDENKLPEFLSGVDFPEGAEPLAMAYAGHQFGHFSPQLGDGRAMLVGEFLGNDKKRYDLHLKGSGRTKFSRRGDGLSALGPAIREFLVSEGMAALKIPTTRSLAVVRTNETVQRETELPGGVLARVGQSHIRVGTFEYFARRGDLTNLKILADYTIERLYPGLSYLDFWREVARKQIELITDWMQVGFIHGVMNTDNMAISGETIDFGPCAFMDEFRYDKVFSSIDEHGRYAYSHQPQIALWNLARLAECMIPFVGEPEKTAELFTKELKDLQNSISPIFMKKMGLKFGLKNSGTNDEELIATWFQFLENNELDFTLSYIDLERIFENKETHTGLESKSGYQEFKQKLDARLQNENSSFEEASQRMKLINPMTIPRNHQVEKAIQKSNRGEDEAFFKLLEAIRNPFTRLDKLGEYQKSPKKEERVLRTFCGT